VAFRISLSALLQLAIHQGSSPIISQVLSSLGDITGWAAATTSAVTGDATLAVK
jgi:hypothetical protein